MAAKSRELTPEFRKKYVQKIGGNRGKDAVLYNGLLALAHEESEYGHIEVKITQYPSPENKFTAFARAEIFNKDGRRVGMEEADANASNCGKMTAASFPRMACTRAKARAFRDYLNVDMVCSEEIAVYEVEKADPKVIGKIKRHGKDAKIKKEKMYKLLYEQTGCESFNDLSTQSAKEFLEYLKENRPVSNDNDIFDMEDAG
ncbi:hypothetical protein ACK8P5_26320 (plasmid) [Paenibacillus sp. EC2-1]|uniref:hypothetical protein n=1 Tax=Paenibacillus sp. EC2-1 TaxID=3388665 RepID=UPI003BEEC7AA